MPSSLDLVVEFPASVEQVHSAFSDEDYWLARLAAFGGSTTLDSLIVHADATRCPGRSRRCFPVT